MGSRILTIQRRVRELGRIRTGDSEPYTTQAGKQARRPVRSGVFILSAAFRDNLDLAAEMWGGTVEPWQPQGGGAQIWRVVTETSTLPAILPPGDPVSQVYELWNAGGAVRRCDGQTDAQSGKPCLCAAQYGHDWYDKTLPMGAVCKPHTRLNVFLPLADFGYWRLETSSYWAATEITGVVDMIRIRIGPDPAVPITLGIEQRERVKDGKRLSYPVVTVGLRGTTTAAILAGVAPVLAVEGAGVKAIEASAQDGVSSAADNIATPANAPGPTWLQAVQLVTTLEELRDIWRAASGAGELDEELKKAFWARQKILAGTTAAPAQAAASAGPALDVDTVWTQILVEASHKGWNLPEVESQFRIRMGKDPSEADADTMAVFRDELTAGKL